MPRLPLYLCVLAPKCANSTQQTSSLTPRAGCQRETGSAFVLNATIELSRYTNLGADPILTDIPSATGQGQCIARCPKCYIAVWSVYGGGSDMPLRTVRVGTLDDPNVCPPQCHIYTSTKQKWLKLQDELPEHAEEYDREKYWDKESLERMAKVREEIERLEEEGKNVSL